MRGGVAAWDQIRPLTGRGLLRRRAEAAETGTNSSRDHVSLIILFLKGGLSTIDTLDMKPAAPSEFRGEFDPISTSAPFGIVKFASIFPNWRNKRIGSHCCAHSLIRTRITVLPIIGC